SKRIAAYRSSCPAMNTMSLKSLFSPFRSGLYQNWMSRVSSGLGCFVAREGTLAGEAVSRLGGERRSAGEEQLNGLLQFACGLPTPNLSEPDVSPVSRAVTVGDVLERRRSLRSWLLPPGNDFQLHGLTDIFADHAALPPHTWLLQLSRHSAV